jgi:transcriptional regulator with XRE-family HTH domain
MKVYESPGDKVRQWRSRHGLNQAALAADLGVSLNTVSRWELGQRGVPPFLLLALAELERILDARIEKRRNSRHVTK